MERIRIYRWLLMPTALCVLLCGCSYTPRVADYRQSGFRAEVAWESEGLAIVAVAEATAPAEGLSQTVTLTVSEPPSLSGLVLRGSISENAEVHIEWGELALDERSVGALWEITELLLPTGVFQSICRVEGEELIYVQIVPNKDEQGEECYEVYTEPQNGSPRRVVRGDKKVEFRSFTFLA